ncbi:MAG: TRAP transporter small permease subunit [Dehalococcoidia bacterium]|jgi:TRAP-type mannitol/chloroaromatic compound transport system permease small subunit|nr:TRAP transporter small permease subunit [Dehalococcoidia bacterium]
MRTILRTIDSVNEWVGRRLKWVVLFLVLVVCAEVMMRYVFNSPTSQLPVIQTWTGTALYSLAFGYVMLHKAHVRVDVIYGRFTERGKAIVDIILWFLFFLPSVGFITYSGFNWMVHAWKTHERSMITYWYPPMAPIRTIVFIGMVLFLLQGLATLYRDFHMAVRRKSYD